MTAKIFFFTVTSRHSGTFERSEVRCRKERPVVGQAREPASASSARNVDSRKLRVLWLCETVGRFFPFPSTPVSVPVPLRDSYFYFLCVFGSTRFSTWLPQRPVGSSNRGRPSTTNAAALQRPEHRHPSLMRSTQHNSSGRGPVFLAHRSQVMNGRCRRCSAAGESCEREKRQRSTVHGSAGTTMLAEAEGQCPKSGRAWTENMEHRRAL